MVLAVLLGSALPPQLIEPARQVLNDLAVQKQLASRVVQFRQQIVHAPLGGAAGVLQEESSVD
jgi:hypothetical protein